MAKRLAVINKLRPKIKSQGVVGFEQLAERIAKNTTYNKEEIYSILRLMATEVNEALQHGETVKFDNLVSLKANMKVGGQVGISATVDRGASAFMNNRTLWTSERLINAANLTKTVTEIIEDWNKNNPNDPVVD